MYTILKLEKGTKVSFWERLKRRLGLAPKSPFLELLYDPFSGYLMYRDHGREHSLKKDLFRSLILFSDIRERVELFGPTLQVTTNNLVDFLEITADSIVDPETIYGTDRLSEQNMILVVREFLEHNTDIDRATKVILRKQSGSVIMKNF